MFVSSKSLISESSPTITSNYDTTLHLNTVMFLLDVTPLTKKIVLKNNSSI